MRLGSLFVIAACTASASSAWANLGENGVNMNGVNMNGVNMNGVNMNGVNMNGVNMNGVQIASATVGGLALDGTYLTGTLIDANSVCAHSQKQVGKALPAWCSPCTKIVAAHQPSCAKHAWTAECVETAKTYCAVYADDMVGSLFVADTTGGPRYMYLQSVQKAPEPDPTPRYLETPSHGAIDVNAVYLYQFWSFSPTGSSMIGPWSWQPLCPKPVDAQGHTLNQAIPIAGRWADCQGNKAAGCGGRTSTDGFTLACNDVGALAKCVRRFDYKWWMSAPETFLDVTHAQTLDPYFRACVRMVRGDYCGDGTPHTVDGTAIDAWDFPGVQQQEAQEPDGFFFEAGWNPDGAACIGLTRFQSFGGSTSPPPRDGKPHYPDAIAQCTQLSPVQYAPNGQIYIIDGCGNFYNINPNGNLPLSPAAPDWVRNSYYIANDSLQFPPAPTKP